MSIFKQGGYRNIVFIQVQNKIQIFFSPECRSVPGWLVRPGSESCNWYVDDDDEVPSAVLFEVIYAPYVDAE